MFKYAIINENEYIQQMTGDKDDHEPTTAYAQTINGR